MVARRPSSTPAAASTNTPEQIELTLAALAMRRQHEPPRYVVGDRRTVVATHDVEAEIQARGAAGRGQPRLLLDLTLVDIEHVAESNAILFYLADGSPFLASDRLARSLTLQWLFFEVQP